MHHAIWDQAIAAAVAPKRAAHFLETMSTTGAGEALTGGTAQQAGVLAALWSGSPALREIRRAIRQAYGRFFAP